MPTTRLYQVKMRAKKKRFLVEATSREHAIRIATDPLVKDVTIPTPLEAIRLQGEGVEILTKANASAIVGGDDLVKADGLSTSEGGGVGRIGLGSIEGGSGDVTAADDNILVKESDAGGWMVSNPPGPPFTFDTRAEAESKQRELRDALKLNAPSADAGDARK